MTIPTRRLVTLGVAGTGTAKYELVSDALNLHYAFGPADGRGYFAPSPDYDVRVLIPGSTAHSNAGTRVVCDWVVNCDLPYVLLRDGTESPAVTYLATNVVDPETDVVVVEDITAEMVRRLTAPGANGMLVVLRDGDVYDETTERQVVTAMRAGVPAFLLSEALIEIGWEDLNREPVEPERPAAADEAVATVVEPGGQVALSVSGLGEDLTLTFDDQHVLTAFCGEARRVLTLVGNFYRDDGPTLLRALDRIEKTLLPPPSPPPRPVAPLTVPYPTGGDTGKTRLEVLDPDSGEWAPAGRGRPKKGLQTRRVPKIRTS